MKLEFNLNFLLFVFLCLVACDSSESENKDPNAITYGKVEVLPGKNYKSTEPQQDPNKKITNFRLRGTKNGYLFDHSVEGLICGNKITLVSQQYIKKEDTQNLIATFEYEGSKITVNGTEQQNEVSRNDFSKPITYTVTSNKDQSTVDYTVTLSLPQNSGLPSIVINTENKQEPVDKITYVPGTVEIIDPNNQSYNATYKMGVRLRGNTTLTLEKKPYRIKLDTKQSVLGLAPEKSWVLLANYLDPSLITNTVALELGRRLGLKYTNHYRPVELFFNGHHQGSYLLTEQIEVGEGRVNIDKKTGFLIELDTTIPDPRYELNPDWAFKSENLKIPITVKSPDFDKNYSDAVDKSIKKSFNDLETALFSSSFPNNNYKDLIDIESVINYLLVNEIVQNSEVLRPKSCYMYKEAEQKFFMGPIWDFDFGFGYSANDDWKYFTSRTLLFYPKSTNQYSGAKFLSRFLDDPEFRTLYKARWNEIKDKEVKTLTSFIDQQTELLKLSQSHNYHVFPNSLDGFDTKPESHNRVYRDVPNDLVYEKVIANMKEWLNDRIIYLDKAINGF